MFSWEDNIFFDSWPRQMQDLEIFTALRDELSFLAPQKLGANKDGGKTGFQQQKKGYDGIIQGIKPNKITRRRRDFQSWAKLVELLQLGHRFDFMLGILLRVVSGGWVKHWLSTPFHLGGLGNSKYGLRWPIPLNILRFLNMFVLIDGILLCWFCWQFDIRVYWYSKFFLML